MIPWHQLNEDRDIERTGLDALRSNAMTTLELPGIGQLRLNSEHLPRLRVLMLEDEQDGAEVHVDALESDDLCQVSVAPTAAQASARLQAQRYDVVVADIVLADDGERIQEQQGDDWIIENAPRISPGLCAVLTGHPDMAKKRNANFKALGIPVYTKADNSPDLVARIKDMAREKRSDYLSRVRSAIEEAITDTRMSRLNKELKANMVELCVTHLRGRPQSEKATIHIGGRQLSMLDLASEVEGDSALGRAFLSAFSLTLKKLTSRR